MIDKQLRQAIKRSGLTHYRIGKMAGVTPTMIDKFVAGRDVSLTTAAKLAAALALELTPAAQASSATGAKRKGTS